MLNTPLDQHLVDSRRAIGLLGFGLREWCQVVMLKRSRTLAVYASWLMDSVWLAVGINGVGLFENHVAGGGYGADRSDRCHFDDAGRRLVVVDAGNLVEASQHPSGFPANYISLSVGIACVRPAAADDLAVAGWDLNGPAVKFGQLGHFKFFGCFPVAPLR